MPLLWLLNRGRWSQGPTGSQNYWSIALRNSADITETELAILDVLWRRGGARVRDIVQQLYPEGGASKNATVHSLLERLEQKQFVRRDRSSFAHTFHATVERGDFVGSEIRRMADRVFDGSLTPILMNLAREVRLSPQEREEILRLIESQEDSEEHLDGEAPGEGGEA